MYICSVNSARMIEQCPKLSDKTVFKAIRHLSDNSIISLVESINDSYLYWSDVKYKKTPSELTPEELWACVKMSRNLKNLSIWKKYDIKFSITNKMQRQCHDFDMNFGGYWGDNSIIPSANKERYLISSLMEEAISSSQMEGASTTRKIAKNMLRKNISPRSRSEQMIFNNYETICFIIENKNRPLTSELLLRVHALMTNKTLDQSEDEGCFRKNDDVVVANSITDEIVHIPPTFTEIPDFVDDLCRFFNSEDGGTFIHPIIRAVIIHFMIAYMHPFADGNGRTARALFYWYMLKKGYWLMEYMSISRIIYMSKKSYEKSFLYSESDNNDIGYFIAYNLRVLELAFNDLQRYIRRKTAQLALSPDFAKLEGINDRQSVVLALVRDNPNTVLTVKELQNRFGISNPTARQDMEKLVESGYLQKIRVNKIKYNYVKGDKFDELLP